MAFTAKWNIFIPYRALKHLIWHETLKIRYKSRSRFITKKPFDPGESKVYEFNIYI